MTDTPGSATAGTPAATTADTTTASTSTAATTTTNDSWTATFTNPETKGFAELRGWKSPEQAVESFRQLEKFQGLPPERLAKIPEADDAAGWAEFKGKFGWAPPAEAKDYGLSSIEGFDPGFVTGAEGVLHKHGVPKDMAQAAMKDIGGLLAEMETQFNTTRQAAFDGDLTKLKTEWGANFEGLVETGKRAAAEYMPKTGLAEGDMDAIRDAIGQAKFNKLWAGIGSTMGEASFVQSDTTKPINGLMTPDAARARIDQLSHDREWFQRYEKGGVKEVQEYNMLKNILANATL